jgi:hypothetical protein
VDLGALPPNEADPSKKPETPSEVKVTKDIDQLSGLTAPYGSPEARRVEYLLQKPSRGALAEAREILLSTESRSVQTFIGDRLGKIFDPRHVEFAIDLLRLKSLPCTDAFLRALARRELGAVRQEISSPLTGHDMAPLRMEIAKLCVDAQCFFTDETRARYGHEIEKLAFLPIVILRRCASTEVVPILVKAATTGGIDPGMNRLALEALTYVEAGDPHERVTPGRSVAALAGTMECFLREPLNRMDVYSFVDQWLSKSARDGSTTAEPVMEVLHRSWEEYRSGTIVSVENRGLNILDVIALLRHFDDPTSRLIRQQACEVPHFGISALAHLTDCGPTHSLLWSILEACSPAAPLRERLRAFRLFSYRLSDEVDRRILPLYLHVVSRTFRDGEAHAPVSEIAAERVALMSVLGRRLYTQPLQGPFLSGILSEAMTREVGEASLVASTLMAIAREARVMPLSFYDDPYQLTPLGLTIALLRERSKVAGSAVSEIADEIEGHFILDGPARFGFQLARTHT